MLPLDLGETLDAAFRIVRRRWRTLALVMVAVAIPVELLSFLVTVIAIDPADATGETLFTGGDDSGAYAAGAIVWTLTLVGSLLGTVACYRAVTDTYAGRDTSAAASLRFAVDRLAPALWLMILLVLGIVAGFLACVVPGVWLGVAWAVAIPVLLVEGLKGTAAMRRSYELVRGRWWQTFGRLAVAYLLALIASGVVSAILTLPIDAADVDSVVLLAAQHVADALTSLIATPFMAAVTMLVYFDLRARKEGFDPSADEAGGVAEEPPAAPLGAPSTPPPPAPSGPWLPPVAPDRPADEGPA